MICQFVIRYLSCHYRTKVEIVDMEDDIFYFLMTMTSYALILVNVLLIDKFEGILKCLTQTYF
jgi:hypothetical protein